MPRKTPGHIDGRPQDAAASMRPRPDAAENRRRAARRPDEVNASMRPRPDAAENAIGNAPRASPAIRLQ